MEISPAAVVAAVVFCVFQVSALTGAQAYTETTLYSFCSQANCADGANPVGGVVSDASGNLFGTTSEGGGDLSTGTVFELVRPKDKARSWTLRTLYTFCVDGFCRDGQNPVGGLIFDVAGNLYGTTSGGDFGGTIFELSPKGDHWKFKTLYSFCPQGCGKADGSSPRGTLAYAGSSAGALYDGVSPLYGTTPFGGANGTGIVFQLTPSHGHWKKKTIHDFSSSDSDGDTANAQLFIDGAGDIFGTTELGGTEGSGALFEFIPERNKTWSYKILHSFCSECAQGYEPGTGGALAMDGAGNVYGTTMFGAAGDAGAIFKLLPNGRKSQISTVFSFSCVNSVCPDGYYPLGGIVLDDAGSIFSLEQFGGAAGYGTLLQLSPSGEKLGRYDFCSQENCLDGGYPTATVIKDQAGDLFGTTWRGGAHDDGSEYGGTIFELTP